MSTSNKKYEHILLATDLVADETLLRERAVELADHYGARLSAVHVIYNVPSIAYMYGYTNGKEIEEKLFEESTKAMTKIGSELKISQEDQKIVFGNAKEKIVEIAEETNCDLIIIGAHTRHGVAKFLGATANGVINSASCDVFVVKCPVLGEA